MAEKYIMLGLEDEKTEKVSEVLGSKVCKKILSLLAEKNLSETDIAKELKIPISTLEYNLKKLISSGFVEKAKEHFWSQRGKKIPIYKASKKTIIISPKISGTVKSILATTLISVVAALWIKFYSSSVYAANALKPQDLQTTISIAKEAATASVNMAPSVLSMQPPIWLWFLFGSLFSVLILLILNWKKL